MSFSGFGATQMGAYTVISNTNRMLANRKRSGSGGEPPDDEEPEEKPKKDYSVIAICIAVGLVWVALIYFAVWG